MRTLFTVLRWALKRGYVETLPPFPELPTGYYERFIPPTPEEAARIYACAPPHIQRVIALGCKTGLRIGECELFKLKWCDVDFENRKLRAQAAGKNPDQPWREIPILSSLLPLMKSWYEEDKKKGCAEYVINFHGHGVNKIDSGWARALKSAGITRRIRPYDLRHAFATDMLAAGVDIGTTASLMGHSNPMMLLKHYQHVATKQKIQAIESLPELKIDFTANS